MNPWKTLQLFSTRLDQTGGARLAPSSAADSNCPSASATHRIMPASAVIVVTRIWIQDQVFQLRVYYQTLLSEVFKIQKASGMKCMIKNVTLQHVFFPSFRSLYLILCNDWIWNSHQHAFIILCVCFLIWDISGIKTGPAFVQTWLRSEGPGAARPDVLVLLLPPRKWSFNYLARERWGFITIPPGNGGANGALCCIFPLRRGRLITWWISENRSRVKHATLSRLSPVC